MDLLSTASAQSAFRGYDYYTRNAVRDYKKLDSTHYQGRVSGSNDNVYDVLIDLEHPKKSQCTCPFATGRYVVCKHMVALYFTIFPDEAKQFICEVERANQEAEKFEEAQEFEEEIVEKLEYYIRHLKKAELQDMLLDLLFDGPEWQYEQFILDHFNEIY